MIRRVADERTLATTARAIGAVGVGGPRQLAAASSRPRVGVAERLQQCVPVVQRPRLHERPDLRAREGGGDAGAVQRLVPATEALPEEVDGTPDRQVSPPSVFIRVIAQSPYLAK
jgi:hypothetical protein